MSDFRAEARRAVTSADTDRYCEEMMVDADSGNIRTVARPAETIEKGRDLPLDAA